ncbi:MAG: SPFH domain-containing protein [Coriobacteriia bacterium]|nr:SPFH domain-containing protein [Coriobacteriia bacterium]
MDYLGLIPVWLPLAIVIIVGVMLVFLWVKRLWVIVPPNQAAVFTGFGKSQYLTNGGRVRVPFFQKVERFDISQFPISVNLTDILAAQLIPVNIEGTALFIVNNDTASLDNFARRFLGRKQVDIEAQLTPIFEGAFRGLVANREVEALNADREQLSQDIITEASETFEKMGLKLEKFTINRIDDRNEFIKSLGVARAAAVKAEAQIRASEETRRSTETVAQNQASAAIVVAQQMKAQKEEQNRTLVAIAEMEGQKQAATAKAEQLALETRATAEAAVFIAEQNALRDKEKAASEVEAARKQVQENKYAADIVTKAVAEKEATIQDAQAEAERIKRVAEAEKAQKVFQAEAEQKRLEAEAAGNKANLLAEAEGLRAKLEAEAAGKQKMAEALNAFSAGAASLLYYPDTLSAQIATAEAVAAQVGNIDNITLIGNAAEAKGQFDNILNIAPQTIATINAIQAAQGKQGIDIQKLVDVIGDKATDVMPVATGLGAVISDNPAASDIVDKLLDHSNKNVSTDAGGDR